MAPIAPLLAPLVATLLGPPDQSHLDDRSNTPLRRALLLGEDTDAAVTSRRETNRGRDSPSRSVQRESAASVSVEQLRLRSFRRMDR